MFSNGVVITGGTFIQDNSSTRPGKGFKFLKEAVASSAFYDSGERFDPPKCHPNTRVAVIERITDWIAGKIDTDTLILWLYGPAGAGKSAIAQTIAELCHEHGLLLATFFFSRTDPSRNNVKSLIATLTYALVSSIPPTRPLIEQVIEGDPLIFKRSLETQFTNLVLEPLGHLFESGLFKQTNFPPVVIVDGLDECIDQAAQRATVEAFARTTRRYGLPLKFLVASRPEQIIISTFKSSPVHALAFHLPLTNEYQPDDDIRTFLLDKFEEIKRTHPLGTSIPSSWPSYDEVFQLIAKSSGQFIYASIVIRFTSSLRHHPCERLKIILGLRPPRRDLPFVELDALYTQILSSSEDVGTLLKILSVAIVLTGMLGETYDLRPPRIEKVLQLEEGSLQLLLGDISSLVDWDDSETRVKFHHASCPDFLSDRQRSQNLYTDASLAHAELARWSLRAWKDPDIDRDEILHIVDYFHTYCQFAAATPELMQDLWDLPASAWITSMAKIDSELSLHPLWYLPPPTSKYSFAYLFISGVFSETNQLYDHHLALVDRYMINLAQDSVGLNSLALFLLLGTGRLNASSDWHGKVLRRNRNHDFTEQVVTLTYDGKADTFRDALTRIFFIPQDDLLWERETINMLHSRFSKYWNAGVSVADPVHTPPTGYEEFLFDFFNDARQPENIRFDNNRYAQLAMICLQYLSCRSIKEHAMDLAEDKPRPSLLGAQGMAQVAYDWC
ncbi:hypothetical protein NLJ89_g5154 [Agrocybe chaxingu]|uniref:Nephrocystin 3-like N-terminal domain-containing protein n=1 Tax=Agrocybe chaxingu TaxID=84603 RepID=A0A9W8K8P7_9AGAR|nr:hypothetical protein NLJ89_g5154 [Agrocybe chaxingu]